MNLLKCNLLCGEYLIQDTPWLATGSVILLISSIPEQIKEDEYAGLMAGVFKHVFECDMVAINFSRKLIPYLAYLSPSFNGLYRLYRPLEDFVQDQPEFMLFCEKKKYPDFKIINGSDDFLGKNIYRRVYRNIFAYDILVIKLDQFVGCDILITINRGKERNQPFTSKEHHLAEEAVKSLKFYGSDFRLKEAVTTELMSQFETLPKEVIWSGNDSSKFILHWTPQLCQKSNIRDRDAKFLSEVGVYDRIEGRFDENFENWLGKVRVNLQNTDTDGEFEFLKDVGAIEIYDSVKNEMGFSVIRRINKTSNYLKIRDSINEFLWMERYYNNSSTDSHFVLKRVELTVQDFESEFIELKRLKGNDRMRLAVCCYLSNQPHEQIRFHLSSNPQKPISTAYVKIVFNRLLKEVNRQRSLAHLPIFKNLNEMKLHYSKSQKLREYLP